MDIQQYLSSQQPLLFRQFENGIRRGHLSHSYLLSGESGHPLKEIALFLAKTLVCENSQPFADNVCWTCLRIDEGNYADLKIFDGSLATIKKDAMQQLTSDFEKTSSEKAGKLIYILHLIENMTPEAISSLLKFLEEPHQEVYAFLTTENEEKVLPTILSRTQKLRLISDDKSIIIKSATSAGVSKKDAEILAHFYYDNDAIKQASEDETYQTIIKAISNFLKQINLSKYHAHYNIINLINERFLNKETGRLFLDIWVLFLNDLLKRQNGIRPLLSSYGKILEPICGNFKNLDQLLIDALLLRGKIEMNLNLSLMLDHLYHQTLKEYVNE